MIVKYQIGDFYDTLVLPDDVDYSDAEIESMKQERYDKWFAHVSDPTPTNWLRDKDGEVVYDELGNPIPVEG